MDANIESVMTEDNKMLLLDFTGALLAQAIRRELPDSEKTTLLENIERAVGQEENNLPTVAQLIEGVLKQTNCPSPQQCLEYFHAWNSLNEFGYPAWDISKLLIGVLDKWGKPKDRAPMP